ncbi:death-inducer obliterator 1-like [Patiria miniata]|uniref:Death-inducer obliterator 1-like n=1 Tax=Patiria miniata TaxID=46514 RepID=A0A913ZKL8_PATMI|nr:death-inducer obliterator 1-like [Patiria miniata]
MDKDQAVTEASTSGVISESANVVVQRLSTGSPLWNLTATDGETEGEVMGFPYPHLSPGLLAGHGCAASDITYDAACMDIASGMSKEDASLYNIPSAASLLTEDQFHIIDQALLVEAPQPEPKAGTHVSALSREDSMDGRAPVKTESQDSFPSRMVNVGSCDSLDRFVSEGNPMLSENDQFDEQILMNASTDSLKLDIPGVLDLSGESLETRQLLEEVMNSELLEGVIKNECLDGRVAATAVVTTSDGDTSAGEGIKQKGRGGGRRKQGSSEKAVPLRRSERHKKTEEPKVEASQETQVKEEVGKGGPKQDEVKKEDANKDAKKDLEEKVSETKHVKGTRKSQRSKAKDKEEKEKPQEEESEDGYEQDKETLGSSESSKGRHDTRRKRTYRKRKQSKEQETDSDLEDGGKSLKEIQQELKSKRHAQPLKEGHQLIQEGPKKDAEKGAPKSGDANKKDARRRSEEGQQSRSDHTYERRRSGSTSEQGPSLFTPDNAVFIKLGGEGEPKSRTLERRVRDRSKSLGESRNQDLEEGELSSDNAGEDMDNDSDWTSGDDPEKLWCICRKPHDNRFMICCDHCEEWYHGSCVDITKAEGKRLDREKVPWICPVCIEKQKRDTKREMKSAKEGETSNAPTEKPAEKPSQTATVEKAPEDSAVVKSQGPDVKGQGSEVSKADQKEGTGKSPELPHSTKKKRLKFYKPPPPKQHCIGPGCQNWARPGSIYCGNDCIVRHARQSIRLIHQEKEKALGSKYRRDSTGSMANRNIVSPSSHRHEPERIPVLERHTGKVRTGLSAPIQEQVYDFLERHPSYEVLRPGTQHGVAAFYSAKPKQTKDKKDEQIEARVREREREEQKQRDAKSEPKTNPQKDQGREGEKTKDKTPSKEKASTSKEKASTSKEKTPTKEQPEKNKRTEEQAKESVRRNVRESLRDMLATRVKGAKDLKDFEDQVKKKAYMIEYELYRLYNDTGSKYKSRYRSLFFNIKDSKNQGLFRRILKGGIPASKLVRMSSEQLASKELAQWREREAKHSLEIIVHEEAERKSQPLTKKTHKGEVEINDDNLSTLEAHDKETKPTIDMKIIEKNVSSATNPLDNMLVDTTSQHRAHLFDLNCKICTGKMPAPREEDSAPAKKAKVARTASAPEEEGEGPSGSPVGVGGQEAELEKEIVGQMSPMETDDAEPLSQSDDMPSPQNSPIPPSPKEQPPIRRPPPSLWNGSLTMEEVARFIMAGFHVSGPIRTISLDMPENIVICGRIPYPVVWDYFKQLRKANNTDLIVLRFHVVNEEDKPAYISLFQYFHSRQRIGVVGNNRNHIKDMYILPLSAHEPIPQEIMPFKGPGLAEPRPHMLLGLMVRHRDRARSASLGQPPRQSTSHHHHDPHQQPKPQPSQQKRRLSDTHALSMMPHSPTDPEEFLNNPEDHGFEPKRFRPSQEPLFIPEKQLMDPIVAQYANADPTELTAEPYSPTQEEIEAPYDPADVLDVIGEVSKPKGQASGDESGKEASMQSPSKLTSLLQESAQNMSASEIANAASDVTANLLTAFSSKPDLTEQQQLLIKLTQQVEDAKKALLDRQIASLQSEIDRATSDSDFSPGHSSVSTPRQPITVVGGATSQLQVPEGPVDDQQGSPQIRRAPADSSTAIVDDQGGATPTKDEPQSKDVEPKSEPIPTKKDRSALDFIQAKLFEPKAIPSVSSKISAPTPPPISRIPIINVPESEPSPPFQGTYEPEFTPPATTPTYNPASYSYDQSQQQSAPFGEQPYNPDPAYNPAQPTSPVEEYPPKEEPKWTGTRDYDHGKPGPSVSAYPQEDYNRYPYGGNQDVDYRQYEYGQQSFGDRPYDAYNRDYNDPNSRGRGHDWGHRGEQRGDRDARGYGEGKEQDWRYQTRDYGHGYSRY